MGSASAPRPVEDRRRPACRLAGRVGVGLMLASAATPVAEARQIRNELTETLQLVGTRVEQFFARAQSLVCLEIVRLTNLGMSMSPDGMRRTIESELRLSWDPTSGEGEPPEAKTERLVLKINGQPPRKNDPENCTVPEQHSTETQPLSMLLPAQQERYRFSMAGRGRVDGRSAIMLDYAIRRKPTVEVSEVEGNENCISFSLEGGIRGRIWIDANTYDVLRLDQGLIGLIDIPLPRRIMLRQFGTSSWTMERHDISMRFKRVTFSDPEETLVLPVSVMSLRITRGSGSPRLRTETAYTGYRRFLTGGRLVQQD
jgi:hypothetical protein